MKTASCQTVIQLGLLPGAIFVGRFRRGRWLSAPGGGSLAGPWVSSAAGEWPPMAKSAVFEAQYVAHLGEMNADRVWQMLHDQVPGEEPILVSPSHEIDRLLRRAAAQWFIRARLAQWVPEIEPPAPSARPISLAQPKPKPAGQGPGGFLPSKADDPWR